MGKKQYYLCGAVCIVKIEADGESQKVCARGWVDGKLKGLSAG